MSLLGEQRLPLGTRKLHWLPFWTTSCQWSELCKDVESSQRSQGARVAAGCPQGGVLSSLLWCLLVDDLLSDLRRAGFYAQGYADDITIMVSGRFEGVVSERMQVALRLVETWCRKEGLNVNCSG
ncbi:hypothetical protein Trydic_g14577 [Trypoxylus dichotomus]